MDVKIGDFVPVPANEREQRIPIVEAVTGAAIVDENYPHD